MKPINSTAGELRSPKVHVNWKTVAQVSKHENIETPFMLVDLDVIVANCKEFKKALPKVKLFFAVKAFYTQEVVQSILPHVDGFDVASPKELNDLIEFGVDPEKIVFSNPVKAVASIEKAYELGVRKFAFQSLAELTKLQMHAPESEVYARVKINDFNSFVPLSEKFGCDQDEAIDLLNYAKHVGLRPKGFTFHVGSQLLNHESWREAITSANRLVQKARENDIDISWVNIGGGFPTKYFTDDPAIGKVAPYINEVLLNDVEYIAEPGRFIVADSAVIVGRVIGVEDRKNTHWLFLDVGLYQAFLGAQHYDVFPYVPVSLSHQRNDQGMNRQMSSFTLTGPTCDSNDIIAEHILLPSDMANDDLLVFPNTGAYTVAYGSNFNGFPMPKKYFIKNGELL